MSRKQNSLMRFSRTERLAQLSEQEIVIERKKREIQAKLEAQKKKEIEDALKKVESSKQTETTKSEFSKKSWSGFENRNSKNKEKPVEQIKESLTNAFSNDGSFLDQFKKLSQTGLSHVDVQTLNMTKTKETDMKNILDSNEEDGKHKNNELEGNQKDCKNSQLLARKSLDSTVQFAIPPPGVVHLVPQHQSSIVNNSGETVPSLSVQMPQLQGETSAFISKNSQLNSFQSNYPDFSQSSPSVQPPGCNSNKQNNPKSEFGRNLFSLTSFTSEQPLLPTVPQNIPPPLPVQVRHVRSPSAPPTELPKVRSESISMTLKINSVKKLEPIPNPLDIDQGPDSPNSNQCSFKQGKENFEGTFLKNSTTSKLENISSGERESSRISSAFCNNDEDKEHSSQHLTEKYQHWAELVARCGDEFEDSLRARHENDPDLRFLTDINSEEYLTYRKLVSEYRSAMSASEEPAKKMRLNSPKADKKNSAKQIFSETNEPNNPELSYPSSSNLMTLIGKGDTHSENYRTQSGDEGFRSNKVLDTTENLFLPFPKHLPTKETFGKNTKDNGSSEQMKSEEQRKRKRKSRWGEAEPTTSTSTAKLNLQPPGTLPAPKSTLLSQLTRSDPGLIQYARQTFGSTNLSEEDWKKAEDHYKINLLYQDMVKKRAELEKLERQGNFKYEYDSDEDTEGGTWEHKLRQQEMQATQLWAEELTRQAAGKHHIGDFLPPEELERFMEKYNAVKEGREPDLSDYKEYKLKEDNVGYRLLEKMGWKEGQGLGQDGSGITNPVNKAATRHENQGLGLERPDGLEAGDDEYDAYRKRMMLAYRFRPNPLNNPRRPYY